MARPINPRVWRNVNGISGYLSGEDFENKNWGSGVLDTNTGKNWTATKNLNTILQYLNGFKNLLPENDRFNTVMDKIKELGNVKALQLYLSNQGYEGIKDDGIAGLQTMNTLNDFVMRELKGTQELPSKKYDVYTDNNGTTDLTPVIESPIQPQKPVTPYGILKKDDYYGKFNDFASMINFVKNPDNKDLPFVRLATDYLKSKNGLTWNSDQSRIEEAFGVKGKYRKGYNGDLYDIGRVLNDFAGTQDAKIPGYTPSSSKSAQSIIRSYQAKGPHMSKSNYNALTKDLEKNGYENWVQKPNENDLIKNIAFQQTLGIHKNGGKMTQKYQAGGTAPQGDPQEQLIQLVQAAMSGDQQASAQIQLIMQAAQQGDQQAAQLAEMIMQIANQMQGGAPQSARNGAKLNYIKRLKGECPEGYEMTYFKAGGKVCKKCQKKVEKACGGKQLAKCGTKFHKAGGVMESILSEMFAKGGAMNRNKHTAFGEEKGANVVSTNHAGRWGGRRAFNTNGTHQLNKHDKPNKFTAFGDEGKKKPTNVGLVGHHATGKTGRMQNRQKAGTTYKATAFGGEKQKRFHRGAKASSIGRIGSISGYPKGQWGKSGIGRI